MPRPEVTRKIFFENSDLYELEHIERQSRLFRKGYMLKVLDPPHLNPQTKEDYRTVTIKCRISNCK
jgi:hypothetical protein